MKPETSNILNGTKWQVLRTDRTPAMSILTMLYKTYDELPATAATVNICNSLYNLQKNNVTVAALCEWVELNNGYRIKNKKDFYYIVHTIALHA